MKHRPYSSVFDPAVARRRAELVRRSADASADPESKRKSEELAEIIDQRAVRSEAFLRDPIGYTRKEQLWKKYEHLLPDSPDVLKLQSTIVAYKLFAIYGDDASAHAAKLPRQLGIMSKITHYGKG